jgi:hypothetical protein
MANEIEDGHVRPRLDQIKVAELADRAEFRARVRMNLQSVRHNPTLATVSSVVGFFQRCIKLKLLHLTRMLN